MNGLGLPEIKHVEFILKAKWELVYLTRIISNFLGETKKSDPYIKVYLISQKNEQSCQ